VCIRTKQIDETGLALSIKQFGDFKLKLVATRLGQGGWASNSPPILQPNRALFDINQQTSLFA